MLAAIAREYDDAVGVTVFSDRLRAALPARRAPASCAACSTWSRRSTPS